MTNLIRSGATVLCAGLLVQVAGCETTTCTTDADCLVGEMCVVDTCEPIPVGDAGPDAEPDASGTKCTIANELEDCDGYACIMASTDPDGLCATECKDSGDCTDGYECNLTTEVCEAEPEGYRYLAIVSTVPFDSNADLSSTTPGPDIDAIEVVQGGTSYFANAIVSSVQGAGGVPSNSYDTQATILGQNDSVPDAITPGSCDIANATDHWWSMGDETGYVVVSFVDGSGNPLYIESGATINVYELDNVICTDVTTDYEDTYDVYLGEECDTTTAPLEFALSLGSSNLSGGVFIGTVP